MTAGPPSVINGGIPGVDDSFARPANGEPAMPRPAVAAVAFLMLLAAAARADDADALVRRLAADDFPARETATLQLLKLGRAAAEALRRGTSADDPEVRRRCAWLL